MLRDIQKSDPLPLSESPHTLVVPDSAAAELMITPDVLATFLHTTPSSLAQMRYRGDGPKFVRVGRRRILYRWLDVQTWIHDSTCTRSDG